MYAGDGPAWFYLALPGFVVHGGSGTMGVASQARSVRGSSSLGGGQRAVGQGRGTLMTVFARESGTTPPLQLSDGLVADLVCGLVKGPVPAEHMERPAG